jgi:pimeloyl-ACP methyl ester carboxylesterase
MMRAFDLALTVLLCAGLTAAQEHISFPTPDGYRLNADLYGNGSRAIVLVHGGRFNKESWEKQARLFVEAGFRVLAINFRGYGQSKAGMKTTDENSYPDVLAAVRYLRSTGSKSVSLVGASMGGDAAADAVMESRPGEIERTVSSVLPQGTHRSGSRGESCLS